MYAFRAFYSKRYLRLWIMACKSFFQCCRFFTDENFRESEYLLVKPHVFCLWNKFWKLHSSPKPQNFQYTYLMKRLNYFCSIKLLLFFIEFIRPDFRIIWNHIVERVGCWLFQIKNAWGFSWRCEDSILWYFRIYNISTGHFPLFMKLEACVNFLSL